MFSNHRLILRSVLPKANKFSFFDCTDHHFLVTRCWTTCMYAKTRTCIPIPDSINFSCKIVSIRKQVRESAPSKLPLERKQSLCRQRVDRSARLSLSFLTREWIRWKIPVVTWTRVCFTLARMVFRRNLDLLMFQKRQGVADGSKEVQCPAVDGYSRVILRRILFPKVRITRENDSWKCVWKLCSCREGWNMIFRPYWNIFLGSLGSWWRGELRYRNIIFPV